MKREPAPIAVKITGPVLRLGSDHRSTVPGAGSACRDVSARLARTGAIAGWLVRTEYSTGGPELAGTALRASTLAWYQADDLTALTAL